MARPPFLQHRVPHLASVWIVTLMRWGTIVLPIALCTGTACALFLWLLDVVTTCRFAHPWLLWLLPLAGVAVGGVYHRFGRAAEGGNNLLIDQIHQPGGGVPLRMAPLVLGGTVISHLFGASVGREGTAVQMGGSIAAGVARALRLDAATTRLALTCGIAAGFGAVFGTPLAGTVFAMEVLTLGRIEYPALLPACLASLGADWVCRAWGIHHTAYSLSLLPATGITAVLLAKVALAAIAFGLASHVFAVSVHGLAKVFRTLCPLPWLRPALGGGLTILFVLMLGTRDYLGLGVVAPLAASGANGASIVNFLHQPGPPLGWMWKILFTVTALASGFKGGEVTPLFFIGAGLGNALAPLVGVPVDLLAAIGFIAVFAAAANTPLACILMGVELFGAAPLIPLSLGCIVAYLCSGHTGIYLSQRIGTPKAAHYRSTPGATLRQLRE